MARLAGNLISYGCGELANYLARRGVVDEVRFWAPSGRMGRWGEAIPRGRAADAAPVDRRNSVHVGGGEAVVSAARRTLTSMGRESKMRVESNVFSLFSSGFILVPPAGFEPAAFCSGGRRSIP